VTGSALLDRIIRLAIWRTPVAGRGSLNFLKKVSKNRLGAWLCRFFAAGHSAIALCMPATHRGDRGERFARETSERSKG